MERRTSLVILSVGLAGLLLASVAFAQEPVVRALLFWAEGCPHCHVVLEEVLPPLQEKYGEALEIKTLEVSTPENYELFLAAEEMYQVAADRRAVPTLFIGDHVLVGSYEIAEGLPGLIEEYLAVGGVDCLSLSGLVKETATTEPTPTIEESLIPTGTPEIARSAAIHLAYFCDAGCQECDRARYDLIYMEGKYPQLMVETYCVDEEPALCEWLGEKAGVPEEKRLTAPAVFIGDDYLLGDEVSPGNLEALLARYLDQGAEAFWEGWEEEKGEAEANLLTRFHSFGVLTVVGAAAVDGLNPCAFATVAFLIAYLSAMGRRGITIFVVGLSFTVGVFLTYFGVGLGFLRFLVALPFLNTIARWLYLATALLCLALAAGSIYDYFQARRGKPERMALKLPHRLRKWVNRVIREGAGVRSTAPVAFVTGASVSLIELACTGQVYLPTIIFVLGVPAMRVRALAYLFLYNVVFILPLMVVFLLAYFGTTSQQMGRFLERRTGSIKLITAVLFVILAGWLLKAMV
jgi:cytochrome c biogenesis protein CcdA/glutaredoxin